MVAGVSLEVVLVLVGVLLFLSVLASKASAKLGIPALALFLGLGMLAGSDGPGGISFDDPGLAKTLGSVALAFILFAGGLDTAWERVRPVIVPGLLLSTLGVLLTAGLVGYFAYRFLGFSLLEGLLLGAVVSSTDAAAVFGVLRSRTISLKHRITPLLELESGTNDPLAVFLTIGLLELLMSPGASIGALVPQFLLQMPIGLAVGGLGGFAAVWLINRVRLEYDGLYPAITIALICLTYGGASLLGGNEFLAVYTAGLTMGSRNFLHKLGLLQFHDGLAWMMQITMFLALGLLSFPSQVLQVSVAGLALSGFLIFVARPAAVYLSLAASPMSFAGKAVVAWAGLRGAVPIILATFPLTEGIPKADLIFNLVFFVVLTSVIVQGTTLPSVARWLGMMEDRKPELPEKPIPPNADLLEIELPPDADAVGRMVVELPLPPTALLVLLRRGEEGYIPRGSTLLKAHDVLVVATRKEDQAELRQLFTRPLSISRRIRKLARRDE